MRAQVQAGEDTQVCLSIVTYAYASSGACGCPSALGQVAACRMRRAVKAEAWIRFLTVRQKGRALGLIHCTVGRCSKAAPVMSPAITSLCLVVLRAFHGRLPLGSLPCHLIVPGAVGQLRTSACLSALPLSQEVPFPGPFPVSPPLLAVAPGATAQGVHAAISQSRCWPP